MTNMQKGLLLAGIQIGIVLSLGGKLLVDRARYPRVWAETVAYDPNAPIRGRYLSVRLKVQADSVYPLPLDEERQKNPWMERHEVKVLAVDGKLVVIPSEEGTGLFVTRSSFSGGTPVLEEPVAYFISEHAKDPSILQPGERLWVEVTVSRKGPPRPIRLGMKKDGVLTPINLD